MIKFNGKDVIPRFNGKDVNRVMYNGKQIYPDNKGIDPATAPNGVYVYSNDGLLYNPDDWDTVNNDSAVGVAVVTDDCKFAIGKTRRNEGVAWSIALNGTDVSGILSATDSTTALTDFAGENNSRLIREAASKENSSNNAAHWCYAQTITVNGATKHGYLAALGEWRAAYNNKSAVDSALSKIEGKSMIVGRHWSSTEYNANYAWSLYWLNGSPGNDYTKEYFSRYVRSFFPLT